MTEELKELSIKMFNAGVLKFGEFYTSNGCVLDMWFDLLPLLAFPSLMDEICEHACEFFIKKNLDCSAICGVTYAGLPFGSLMASKLCKPLLIWKKEWFYNLAHRRIQGKVLDNECCIVIEEVSCSGRSCLEVIKDIEDSGMKVENVYNIIDLEQGAAENLGKMGYKVHSMLKMSQFTEILYTEKLITVDNYQSLIRGFSDKFSINGDCITNTNLGSRRLLRYEERLKFCKSKICEKLFKLMIEKESNICVEFIDQNVDTILQAAKLIGSYICVLSIQWNLVKINEELKLKQLVELSKNLNFLIMDNSNLCEDEDILAEECRQRLKFVDILTIYPITGENMLLSVKSVINNEFRQEKGVFVVASPSIADAIIGSKNESTSIKMTMNIFEEITGFISRKNSEIPLGYIHMTSDLKNSAAVVKSLTNAFYSSEVIVDNIGADIIQLHYNSLTNIDELVKKERVLLWNAYLQRSENIPRL